MDGERRGLRDGRGPLRVVWQDSIKAWVAERLPEVGDAGFFEPCRGYAVVGDGDEILAGLVYHDYYPNYQTVQVSLAAATPRWASKRIVGRLLSIPFELYGCRKIWASTLHSNSHALRFIVGVGFEKEAVLTDFYGEGKHAVVTSFGRDAWLERYGNGQEQQGTPGA